MQYFAVGNAHHVNRLAPLCAKDGTYEDPVSRMAVHSWDLATVLWSIEAGLPDFSFEISSIACAADGASVEWSFAERILRSDRLNLLAHAFQKRREGKSPHLTDDGA